MTNLQLCLFGIKDADAGDTYIKDICIQGTWLRRIIMKIVCIKNTCTNNICARGTYAKNVFSAISAYIKSVSLKNTCTKDISKKNTYIKNADTIENSKIYLYFFSILKVNLFNMD